MAVSATTEETYGTVKFAFTSREMTVTNNTSERLVILGLGGDIPIWTDITAGQQRTITIKNSMAPHGFVLWDSSKSNRTAVVPYFYQGTAATVTVRI